MSDALLRSRRDAKRLPADSPWIRARMTLADRLKRLRFRAWHRGTKEADLLIGGFYDHYAGSWNEEEVALFETLLEEQDVDIMAWALGTAEPPARYAGTVMQALRRADYIPIAR